MRRLLAFALLTAGCAAAPAPQAPSASAPPELIALSHFFASREANWGYRVSPDGTRLGWIASHGGRSTVHFRTLGADDVRPIDTHSRRTVYSFTRGADSRRIVTFYEKVPPHWQLGVMPLFHKYVGDPSWPDDRRRLEAKSPLFKAHQVERPLLIIHGARDTRVNVRESDQMVRALRQAGKDVRYVVFPDEGHLRTYGNWRNTMRRYTEVENFLAGCLGGRRSG